MSKIEPLAAKIYKPEILSCAKCGGSLKYCYTISNKVVQFTSGKIFRIKNLGYNCPCCNDKNVYFSQTATKLCFKGYTYSAKVVCMIDYYKIYHLGREEICDILASKGVEISDRNIDILHKKFKSFYDMDYEAKILNAYERMMNEFNTIRLSIDYITLNEKCYIIIYDYFNGSILALWRFNGLNDPSLTETLSKFINPNYNISVIVSVRGVSKFYPVLKSLGSNKIKYMAFCKF